MHVGGPQQDKVFWNSIEPSRSLAENHLSHVRPICAHSSGPAYKIAPKEKLMDNYNSGGASYYTDRCPFGSQQMTSSLECRKAAAIESAVFASEGNWETLPRGCFVSENGQFYWNSAQSTVFVAHLGSAEKTEGRFKTARPVCTSDQTGSSIVKPGSGPVAPRAPSDVCYTSCMGYKYGNCKLKQCVSCHECDPSGQGNSGQCGLIQDRPTGCHVMPWWVHVYDKKPLWEQTQLNAQTCDSEPLECNYGKGGIPCQNGGMCLAVCLALAAGFLAVFAAPFKKRRIRV